MEFQLNGRNISQKLKAKTEEKKTNKKQIENRKKYIVAYTELNPLQEEKS